MLCPKCGQEYEGTACPFCSKPEIIVNDSEYLKRKKAYEEKKQAEQRSASSDSVPQETAPEPVEILEQIRHKGALFARKRTERAAKQKKTVQDQPAKPVHSKKRGRRWIKTGVALLALLAVAAASFGIYRLATRKNAVLYMSYNGRIYNVSGLDTQLVCAEKDAVFEVDQNTFYTPAVPEEIHQDQIVQRMAGSGGRYFAAVTYDTVSSKYALYLWDQQSCTKVSEGTKEKEIKFVSEKGSVLYTDTEVVNEEWAVGSVALNLYEAPKGGSIFTDGVLTVLDEDLHSVYIYAGKDTVIFLGKDNRLFTYRIGRDVKSARTLVSGEAKKIYAMSADTDNIYMDRASTVNLSDQADGFIYSANGQYYYHAVSDKPAEEVAVGTATGSGMAFIYEKNSGIYLISADSVRYAPAVKNQVPVYTEIDRLGSASDTVYLSSEDRLLFVNAQGSLISVKKGAAKVLADNVTDGSLNAVGNTQQGITYIREGVRYYRSSPSAQEVRMTQAGQAADTRAALFYKNRLYFYDLSGQLYSCTVKGKDYSIVGEVERFWLGEDYAKNQ